MREVWECLQRMKTPEGAVNPSTFVVGGSYALFDSIGSLIGSGLAVVAYPLETRLLRHCRLLMPVTGFSSVGP